MDWAYAMSQGLAAGAKAGADVIDTRQKAEAAATAEQRAANVKLDTAERMLAIEDAMKTRASERFAKVVKAKMGEQVPLAAQPVSATGLTRDSATDFTLGDGTPARANFQQSPQQLAELARNAKATAENPDATTAQREDARALMEALTAQGEAQSGLNNKAAAGKTRPRTMDEAQQAALDDTLQNDAPAFIAGTGMLSADRKQEAAEKALALKEKLATTEGERKERIAAGHDDQREKAADQRFEALMTRIEAGTTGKAGNKSALRQNVELLQELGYTPDKIEKFIFDKKGLSVADIAAKMLSADKFGELTPEAAATKAQALVNALDKAGAKAAPAAAPGGAAPKMLHYDPATGGFK